MSTDDPQLQASIAVAAVIMKARVEPFTTKSDFARMAANEVALCASEGFITTRVDDYTYTNVWIATADGLQYVEDLEDALASD